jgi:transcriptional regulator with XRE-family HTH domain
MKLINGDSFFELKGVDAESVDALVTDPPAGISFMGKDWWLTGILGQCYRVMKPGAHGLVWALPRTSHWTASAIEKAGFEIRDVVMHVFGSGFPKSLDISKAIDKENGKHNNDLVPFGEYVASQRKKRGWSRKELDGRMGTNTSASWWEGRKDGVQLPSKKTYDKLKDILGMDDRFDFLIDWAEAERKKVGTAQGIKGTHFAAGASQNETTEIDITAPATPEAHQWNGWGTALKPACEHWILCRKPLSEKTVAQNVLKHGTGGVNIDGCRVECDDKAKFPEGVVSKTENTYGAGKGMYDAKPRGGDNHPQGRFPSHLILDEEAGRLLDEQSGESKSDGGTSPHKTIGGGDIYQGGDERGYFNYQDTGGASRFFYCPKPGRAERNEGLEGREKKPGPGSKRSTPAEGRTAALGEPRANFHPTVKSVDLMRYLCRLITPPKGIVLDPFMGSGSTGIAAHEERLDFIGIEKEPDYFEIAEARIKEATKQGSLF